MVLLSPLDCFQALVCFDGALVQSVPRGVNVKSFTTCIVPVCNERFDLIRLPLVLYHSPQYESHLFFPKTEDDCRRDLVLCGFSCAAPMFAVPHKPKSNKQVSNLLAVKVSLQLSRTVREKMVPWK